MHVQSPPARTLHHVAGIQASLAHEAHWTLEARSTLVMAEKRNDDLRWFAGRVFHGLRRERNRLRIVQKRVDLIDCDAPQRALAIPF
jgi:3-phenylpropionate/cinnamic acid dioxygenase small subunit